MSGSLAKDSALCGAFSRLPKTGAKARKYTVHNTNAAAFAGIFYQQIFWQIFLPAEPMLPLLLPCILQRTVSLQPCSQTAPLTAPVLMHRKVALQQRRHRYPVPEKRNRPLAAVLAFTSPPAASTPLSLEDLFPVVFHCLQLTHQPARPIKSPHKKYRAHSRSQFQQSAVA